MAVTSIDIDPSLLAEVKRVTGATSNREAVEAALKRLSWEAQRERQVQAAHSWLQRELSEDELNPRKIDYPAPESDIREASGEAA